MRARGKLSFLSFFVLADNPRLESRGARAALSLLSGIRRKVNAAESNDRLPVIGFGEFGKASFHVAK